MFGLGLPEIIFILLLAALILGPEHMPRAARMIGRWSAKVRSAATSFEDAITSDADLNEIRTNLSDVKKEIEQAGNELKDSQTEVVQITNETHQAFEEARKELKSFQASTGRGQTNLDGTRKLPDEMSKSDVVDPANVAAPSPFMSRPLGQIQRHETSEAQKTGFCKVQLAKARFLPEDVSRVVTKRRVMLDEVCGMATHRTVLFEKIRENAAFCRVRKLSRPVAEDKSCQLRVKV